MKFTFGAKSEDNRLLQMRLAAQGYPPDGGIDGIYGRGTTDAINRFRAYHGLPVTTVVIHAGDGAFEFLFPEVKPIERKPTVFGINLKGIFSSMVFWAVVRYGVAAISQYLAVKFHVDQGDIYGIIFQLITVVAASLGVTASAQDKVVVEGKKVTIADLPTSSQNTIKGIVEANK